MASEVFTIQEHTLPCSYIREYPKATASSQEDILSLCIKQYTPLDLERTEVHEDAITIIGAHANGFPKELYEPLWIELYGRLKAAGKALRGIWIADSAHQGQSSVLNEALLGNDPSWYDHSRDLFLMINHFRAQIRRPIIGIGHSMGCIQLLNLSTIHPRLFTTLIMIDPVMLSIPEPSKADHERISRYYIPARMSIKRRDIWPSRQEAHHAFASSAFYKAWDPRVLALWERFGLRALPTAHYKTGTGVTLTTTKHQEVASFVRLIDETTLSGNRDVHPVYDKSSSSLYRYEPGDMFRRLPDVRPGVLYIYGKHSSVNPPREAAEKVHATGTRTGGSGGVGAGRVQGVVVDAGHLVPMEKVEDTASEAARWICIEMDLYCAEERALREHWFDTVDASERSRVSPELEAALGREGGDGNKGSGRAKL